MFWQGARNPELLDTMFVSMAEAADPLASMCFGKSGANNDEALEQRVADLKDALGQNCAMAEYLSWDENSRMVKTPSGDEFPARLIVGTPNVAVGYKTESGDFVELARAEIAPGAGREYNLGRVREALLRQQPQLAIDPGTDAEIEKGLKIWEQGEGQKKPESYDYGTHGMPHGVPFFNLA